MVLVLIIVHNAFWVEILLLTELDFSSGLDILYTDTNLKTVYDPRDITLIK